MNEPAIHPAPTDPPIGGENTPLVTGARLGQYFDDESQRRDSTRAMFDAGAAGYDRAEAWTGLGSGPWYRRRVLKRMGLKPGDRVLDVATGTGLVAVEIDKLIRPGGVLVGLDPSPGMLEQAKRKLDYEVIEGYAESIPSDADRFDVVTMGYALRHLGSLDDAFGEFLRVLKPGGSVCLMEITKPKTRIGNAAIGFYLRRAVPVMSRLSGDRRSVDTLWRYYWDTIQHCIAPEDIMDAMRRAGFADVRCSTTLSIFKEYFGTKPQG
ncbi:MAG: class I SAM-dependent methyltransferase [Planctomycetota bacterium]